MVQCVVNRLLSCPLVCGFCAWGAALGNARKVSTPPSPKGRYPASRRTRHSCRPPGRPCRESPGLFVLSLSHSSECNRQWVVNPPAQLPWIARRQPFQPPHGRLHALLNASAASESTAAGSLKAASSNASAAGESTTAGGLEAFSQSSAGAERFENASSKFRWNPSPLLPLM